MINKLALKLVLIAATTAVATPTFAQSGTGGGGTAAGTSGTAGLGVDLGALVSVSSPRITLPTSKTKLPGGPIQGLREHFGAKK